MSEDTQSAQNAVTRVSSEDDHMEYESGSNDAEGEDADEDEFSLGNSSDVEDIIPRPRISVKSNCSSCAILKENMKKVSQNTIMMSQKMVQYEKLRQQYEKRAEELAECTGNIEQQSERIVQLEAQNQSILNEICELKAKEKDLVQELTALRPRAQSTDELESKHNKVKETNTRLARLVEEAVSRQEKTQQQLDKVIQLYKRTKSKVDEDKNKQDNLITEKRSLAEKNRSAKKYLIMLFKTLDELVPLIENIPSTSRKRLQVLSQSSLRNSLIGDVPANNPEDSDEEDAGALENILAGGAAPTAPSNIIIPQEQPSYSLRRKQPVKNINLDKPSTSFSSPVQRQIPTENIRSRQPITTRIRHNNPEQIAKQFDEILKKKLAKSTDAQEEQDQSIPTTSATKTILGKKMASVREIQLEQMKKMTVQEKVAKMRENSRYEAAKSLGSQKTTSVKPSTIPASIPIRAEPVESSAIDDLRLTPSPISSPTKSIRAVNDVVSREDIDEIELTTDMAEIPDSTAESLEEDIEENPETNIIEQISQITVAEDTEPDNSESIGTVDVTRVPVKEISKEKTSEIPSKESISSEPSTSAKDPNILEKPRQNLADQKPSAVREPSKFSEVRSIPSTSQAQRAQVSQPTHRSVQEKTNVAILESKHDEHLQKKLSKYSDATSETAQPSATKTILGRKTPTVREIQAEQRKKMSVKDRAALLRKQVQEEAKGDEMPVSKPTDSERTEPISAKNPEILVSLPDNAQIPSASETIAVGPSSEKQAADVTTDELSPEGTNGQTDAESSTEVSPEADNSSEMNIATEDDLTSEVISSIQDSEKISIEAVTKKKPEKRSTVVDDLMLSDSDEELSSVPSNQEIVIPQQESRKSPSLVQEEETNLLLESKKTISPTTSKAEENALPLDGKARVQESRKSASTVQEEETELLLESKKSIPPTTSKAEKNALPLDGKVRLTRKTLNKSKQESKERPSPVQDEVIDVLLESKKFIPPTTSKAELPLNGKARLARKASNKSTVPLKNKEDQPAPPTKVAKPSTAKRQPIVQNAIQVDKDAVPKLRPGRPTKRRGPDDIAPILPKRAAKTIGNKQVPCAPRKEILLTPASIEREFISAVENYTEDTVQQLVQPEFLESFANLSSESVGELLFQVIKRLSGGDMWHGIVQAYSIPGNGSMADRLYNKDEQRVLAVANLIVGEDCRFFVPLLRRLCHAVHTYSAMDKALCGKLFRFIGHCLTFSKKECSEHDSRSLISSIKSCFECVLLNHRAVICPALVYLLRSRENSYLEYLTTPEAEFTRILLSSYLDPSEKKIVDRAWTESLTEKNLLILPEINSDLVESLLDQTYKSSISSKTVNESLPEVCALLLVSKFTPNLHNYRQIAFDSFTSVVNSIATKSGFEKPTENVTGSLYEEARNSDHLLRSTESEEFGNKLLIFFPLFRRIFSESDSGTKRELSIILNDSVEKIRGIIGHLETSSDGSAAALLSVLHSYISVFQHFSPHHRILQ